LSVDEALSVLVEYKLKRTYQAIRNVAKENKCKLYPSYKKVANEKNLCYSRYFIMVIESSAEIKLQAL